MPLSQSCCMSSLQHGVLPAQNVPAVGKSLRITSFLRSINISENGMQETISRTGGLLGILFIILILKNIYDSSHN